MAEVTRYVNTASSGGNGTTNDESGANAAYASLALWEAAEQTDLVAAGDTHVVICSVGSGTAADTTNVGISGWVTSTTNNITIKPAVGEEASDQWDDTIYRLEFGASARLQFFQDVTIQDLQVYGSEILNAATLQCTLAGLTIKVHRCFVRKEMVDCLGNRDPVAIWVSSDDVEILNCIAKLSDTGTNILDQCHAIRAQNNNAGNMKLFNNTAIVEGAVTNDVVASAIYSIDNSTGTFETKNNIGYIRSGNLVAFATFGTITEDYNASSDATAGGSNSRINQTFTFVDEDNLNYQLASSDAGAKGFGTNLSAEGFSDDINRNTRTDPWDIGAVIAQAAGGAASSIARILNVTRIRGLTRIKL